MKSDTKAREPGPAARGADFSSKGKKKIPPQMVLARALFALAGTVAPDTMALLAKRMLFSPARTKPQEPARKVLAAARTEHMTVGDENVCHYIWGDSEQRVLLVHGWAGEAGHMASFVEPLCAAGYQVVALDLPSHGKSTGIESSVVHFERSIANAGKVYGPFQGVIAHSMGAAAVSYSLSRGFPSERAVFFGPVSKYESVWTHFQRMTNLPPKVIQRVVQRAEQWLGISFAEIDPVRLAASLSTPLLVVHDKGDQQSPFQDGEALVANWKRAKMLATEKMGHMRGLRDPHAVQQAVAFVSGAGLQ